MKAYYLIGALGAIALAGCTAVRPVAYQPVITPAPVAVTPATTIVLGAAPAVEGEGVTLTN